MADKLTPAQRQELLRAESRGLLDGADYRAEWNSPMLQKDAVLSTPVPGPELVDGAFEGFLTGRRAGGRGMPLYFVDPLTDQYHTGADYYHRDAALQSALARIADTGSFVKADETAYADHNMTKWQPHKATKQLEMLEFALPGGYYGSERHRREELLSQRIGEPLTEEVKIARRMKHLADSAATPSNFQRETRIYDDEREALLGNVAPGSPTYQGADSAVNQMVRAQYDARRKAMNAYPEGELMKSWNAHLEGEK